MKGGLVDKFRNVGDHPENLADGGVVGVGEFADLSAEDQKDSHNKGLIEDGKLIKVPTRGKED